MKLYKRLRWHASYLIRGAIIGGTAGLTYSLIEATVDQLPIVQMPHVILRGFLIGLTIGLSISFLEIISSYWQRSMKVWHLMLLKLFLYLIVINFWLVVINALSLFSIGHPELFTEYLKSAYLLNLTFSLIIVVLLLVFFQIGKLHRRNELFHYIFGRYHQPKEEELLLLFIDLKGSTSLAEKMGGLKYARYLKDYHWFISEAIFESGGDIYQYVGDEVIIYWKVDSRRQNFRTVHCYEAIKSKIEDMSDYFLGKYDSIPEFRASLHTGTVVRTWVGLKKREILFIGDVLNTASRIQEICKELGKDLLISGQVMDILPHTSEYNYPFEQKFTPRGKQKEILVFSVERNF